MLPPQDSSVLTRGGLGGLSAVSAKSQQEPEFSDPAPLGGQGLDQARAGSLLSCAVGGAGNARWSFSAAAPHRCVFRQPRSVAVLAAGCDKAVLADRV